MTKPLEDLRKIKIFEELPEEDLAAMAGYCLPVHFESNSIIAHQDYQADKLFALISGEVGIWVDHETEKADLLAIQKAPCLVGEMSVVDELPRSATIVSRTPVSGYSMDARSFRNLVLERGHVALSLMKGFSLLVRSSNNSFVSELRQRNAELEKTNRELRNAHRRLIRQERLSSLGRFSSMIIHDLRNPLSVIKGYADMLEYKLSDSSAELQKYASQIRRETGRLAGLISEWLDYSRGELRLAYTAVRIEELFSRLKENVNPLLRARGVKLILDCQCDAVVMLDAERMLRVLINLVDNACKASHSGDSVTVTSRIEADQLVIDVKDIGRGMDQEALAHVFDPFFSTSERGGTGLGMHIVKTVVEAHEGRIEIESEPGAGTEIRIVLPLRM